VVRGRSEAVPSAVERVLQFQRTAGNREVARMLHGAGRPVRRLLSRVLQPVQDSGTTDHARWGDGIVNTEPVPAVGDRPIVIEVMEYNLNSALAKVDQVGAITNNAARATPARIAIAIAFNQRALNDHVDERSLLTTGWTTDAYDAVISGCQQIANRMLQRHVLGAVFPIVWSSTMAGGGYTFPFLEMRARTTLHAATQRLVNVLSDYDEPVVRSMDADVTNDPLLLDRPAGMTKLSEVYAGHVVSGGYDWDTAPKPPAFWGEPGPNANVTRWNTKWTAILAEINRVEHGYRKALLERGGASLLYWPEPNVYMSASTRLAGAGRALAGVKQGEVQMRESVFYLKQHAKAGTLTGAYDTRLRTTKPAKDAYFSGLKKLIMDADQGQPTPQVVEAAMENIWQTHLSPSHVEDIQKETWYGVPHPIMPSDIDPGRSRGVTMLATAVRNLL
jgi:hypothetical protein